VIGPQHVELSQDLVKTGFPRGVIEPSLKESIQRLAELTRTMGPVNDRQKAISATRVITPEPMIQFDHVTFSYPNGFTALKDINLEFHEGDFVLLSGWNGSGKTTLAKHLNGLLRPTEGGMFIKGQNISNRPTSDLAREVGFLFQNPDHQLHRPTVRDELAFSLMNFGVNDSKITELILACAESFQLKPLLDRCPQELSGSEKKKVTVASVLIYEPTIVIFDEPTANLDQTQAKNIIDIIERYFDESKVVLCISHDIRLWVESKRLNRAVVMKDGRVFKQGDPEEIFCDPKIMEFLYGSLLPITQIAQSLSEKGVRTSHYKASTLAEEITKLRKRFNHAASQ
jgi:energy-coupling factor transport system ATP-binding protein